MGREGKGREGRGREGKGVEERVREGKGGEGRAREGKGGRGLDETNPGEGATDEDVRDPALNVAGACSVSLAIVKLAHDPGSEHADQHDDEVPGGEGPALGDGRRDRGGVTGARQAWWGWGRIRQ